MIKIILIYLLKINIPIFLLKLLLPPTKLNMILIKKRKNMNYNYNYNYKKMKLVFKLYLHQINIIKLYHYAIIIQIEFHQILIQF